MLQYGMGIVMLFHGPPGTGKTLMANALASNMNKKLLAITGKTPSLQRMKEHT